MPKKKRKAKNRGKARKRAKKKDNRAMEKWVFTGIVVILLFALLFSMSSENNGLDNELEDTGATWQEQTQEATQTVIEYTCKSNSECFLVNCKSIPDVVECVNSIGMETYYEKCKGIGDVEINRDYSSCGCVDGLCK